MIVPTFRGDHPSGYDAEAALVNLLVADLLAVHAASDTPIAHMQGPRMLVHRLTDEINAAMEVELRRAMRLAGRSL